MPYFLHYMAHPLQKGHQLVFNESNPQLSLGRHVNEYIVHGELQLLIMNNSF